MTERLRIPPAAPFNQALRLRHKPQFDLLYREGRRHSDQYFLVLSKSNGEPHPRLGLSIAAKTVGNAVNRNRIKRVIRESFRIHAHRLPNVDIVVNARTAARAAPNLQLMRSIEQLWDKLARHA
jgi:ribonuclease P protein component